MAFKINSKTLPLDRGFTHNNINYPKNWLRLSTQEDKTALGITWEADPVRYDDRYYWNGELTNPKALEDIDAVDEAGNPLWVKELNNSDPENPVMVDTTERLVTQGLKTQKMAEVKHTAGTILNQTDWYVTRKMEREVAIPADVVTKRAHVVAESDRLEVAIAACADVEALIEVMNNQNWDNTAR
jgi:hypothetical protein